MPTDSLILKRHFKVPREKVFAAFTEKALMQVQARRIFDI